MAENTRSGQLKDSYLLCPTVAAAKTAAGMGGTALPWLLRMSMLGLLVLPEPAVLTVVNGGGGVPPLPSNEFVVESDEFRECIELLLIGFGFVVNVDACGFVLGSDKSSDTLALRSVSTELSAWIEKARLNDEKGGVAAADDDRSVSGEGLAVVVVLGTLLKDEVSGLALADEVSADVESIILILIFKNELSDRCWFFFDSYSLRMRLT